MVRFSSIKPWLLFLGLLLILAADPISKSLSRNVDPFRQAETFAANLDSKTEKAYRLIEKIRIEINQSGPKKAQAIFTDDFRSLFKDEGILIFVFRNDKPALWSDNIIAPVTAKRVASLGTEIHHFDNGWCRLAYLTDGVDEYIAAVLISRTYPYSNEYLQSGFTEDFAFDGIESIHLESKPGSVKLKADHQSFYLATSKNQTSNLSKAWLYFIFVLIGMILVLIGLVSIHDRIDSKRKGYVRFLALLIPLIGLRYLTLIVNRPAYLDQISLLNPALYASSFLSPTFGDLLLNVALIVLIFSIARREMNLSIPPKSSAGKYSVIIAVTISYLFLSAWINQMAKELVLNSSIPFEINNITEINLNTILGVLCMSGMYLATFLVADGLALYSIRAKVSGKEGVLAVSIPIVIWLFATHSFGIRDLAFILWPPLILLTSIYFRRFTSPEIFRFTDAVFFLVVFSTVGAYNLQKYSSIREKNQRQILAEKIIINDDPVAEVLFKGLAEEIRRDNGIRSLFEQDELHSKETLEDFILSRYFTGYWSKYDITIHAFTSDRTIWGKLPDVRPRTFDDLEDYFKKYSELDELKPGIYYLFNAPDRNTYMALIPLDFNMRGSPSGFLVFELASTLFPRELGFPSLLIDREVDGNKKKLEDYSTATYSNGKLIAKRGDFAYPSTSNYYEVAVKNKKNFAEVRGFEHFIATFNSGDIVVISKKKNGPLDNITLVTYLCVINALFFSLIYLLIRIGKNRSIPRLNLNRKIQTLLVVLSGATVILFSFATRYYIEHNYAEKNERLISEKMSSILIELESKLSDEEALNLDMSDYLSRLLSQFSVIFFTDVNLYNPDGDLIASSQIRMFNEGLSSRKINPSAFTYLNYLNQTRYIQEESIGDLQYLSAYAPLVNRRGELIGYANLPYFGRQTELTNELSSFLASVINLFVLVFVLSLIIALFISQWITRPLRSVRESLAAIELGKVNRLVGYEGKDEIGLLVEEYNAKVSELEMNAEKLSQSERESAWREMAKQVAHEIKNPLTPMKLNVQHLERTLLSGNEVEREKALKVMRNLIEQIDSLTSIANAFSGFAKMPKAQLTTLNLREITDSVVALYEGFDHVDFELIDNTTSEPLVEADREQLVRVFNNLLKNAVQSLPDNRRGRIEIQLGELSGNCFIKFSDNGVGIPEDEKPKIFTPNFTTKTRGMGLGLAISKKIIENFNGNIEFTSSEGVGSIFTVELPKKNG